MENSIQKGSLPWGLILLEGIVVLILGILIVLSPGMALVVLVAFLGLYWFLSGIVTLVSILQDRSMWGWKLAIGIVGIFAGIIVIRSPLWNAAFIGSVLGVTLGAIGIFIGVVRIIQAITGRSLGQGILGVLSFLIGLALLFNPLLSTVSLVWIVGILAIVGGIAGIVQAFRQQAYEARHTIRSGGGPVL